MLFFKCGGIRLSRKDNTYKFEVRSIKDLVMKVIPQFERYPLQGKKRQDYELFHEVCKLVYSSKHLHHEGLQKIIELAYQMNPSGKRKYRKEDLLRVLREVKV